MGLSHRSEKGLFERARHADVPEVTQTDLEMAEWLLSREIEEREHAPSQEPPKSDRETCEHLRFRY